MSRQIKREGKIIPNGVVLRSHELATVIMFTNLGIDVVLVPKSNKPGEHSPDIKMLGLFWEIKCPRGKGKWLIKNTVQKASHQAENIIIDLRRIKVHQKRCLTELERYFKLSKRIKNMKIITKSQEIIDWKK